MKMKGYRVRRKCSDRSQKSEVSAMGAVEKEKERKKREEEIKTHS